MKIHQLLAIVLLFQVIACTGGDDNSGSPDGGNVTVGDRTVCDSATTLKEAGECANPPILIGAAIGEVYNNPTCFDDADCNALAVREHNLVTCENEMKWDVIEKVQNQFDYTHADAIVNWAQQNQMKIKGHCLVWHNQVPQWVTDLQGAQPTRDAVQNHIKNIMTYYKGKIHAWDVVNEAVETDGDPGNGNPRMRETVFYKNLGPQYMDEIFQFAREQDPSAKLYYNDYSIDGNTDKLPFVYEMIKGMVERGVPIDGVGFQMHIGPPNNLATGKTVKDNMALFTKLGLEVSITEMDINLCGGDVSAQEQATLYHDIVAACIGNSKCSSITFWGVNDGRSWLNTWHTSPCESLGQSSQALLFDDSYQKKETYQQVLNALTGK
jgi:endo-1,4-beta-xylanase